MTPSFSFVWDRILRWHLQACGVVLVFLSSENVLRTIAFLFTLFLFICFFDIMRAHVWGQRLGANIEDQQIQAAAEQC
jgi:hypothetical protein